MFLFSACSTISAKVAPCLRMSTGLTHTNTATFASGRIMRAAPAVRALAVAAAHRSTPIRLDDRSLDAIADAEAPTPHDPRARCAPARIAAAPQLPPLIEFPYSGQGVEERALRHYECYFASFCDPQFSQLIVLIGRCSPSFSHVFPGCRTKTGTVNST
jgi:hypothetical protein